MTTGFFVRLCIYGHETFWIGFYELDLIPVKEINLLSFEIPNTREVRIKPNFKYTG